jgi:hypothetical protein
MPEIIDLDQSSAFQTKEINLPSPKQKTHLGAIVGLFVSLLIIGGIAFGIGWLASVIKARIAATPATIQGNREASSSSKVEGWVGYSDKENSFSIAYPPEWIAQAHDNKDAAGVLLSNENSSVEVWLKIDQAVSLSNEQKAGLKNSETKSLEISGRPAVLTTNAYLAGNFFNVLVLPATETKPQVTFWLKAEDEDLLDIEMKIVGSFKLD